MKSARIGWVCAAVAMSGAGCHRRETAKVAPPSEAAKPADATKPAAVAKVELPRTPSGVELKVTLPTASEPEKRSARERVARPPVEKPAAAPAPTPPPAKPMGKRARGDDLDALLDGAAGGRGGGGYGRGAVGAMGHGSGVGVGSAYGRGALGGEYWKDEVRARAATSGLMSLRRADVGDPMGGAGDPMGGLDMAAGGGVGGMRGGGGAGGGPRARMVDGGLKAGEWDDNANYREFQKYLQGEAGTGAHAVDVRKRRFLVVRDGDGKAVPRCRVTVVDGRGREVVLTTTAAGRAILFPRAEGLGESLNATARCEGATASAAVPLDAEDGMVDLKLAAKRALPSRTIDVAFILDTTGSMQEEIDAVKNALREAARGAGGAQVKLRVGMVEYRDRGDAYVTRVRPFSSDVAAFARAISDVRADGGGDEPESVNEALHVALAKLDWDAQAVARFAFLVGDAPPHLDYKQDYDYASEMKNAAHRGIQIFTVAASGMDRVGQVVWRQIAQYTDGTNLFVLRGGAGPQSTGGGDPRSSCGGTQTNYTSGNLDALIRNVIDRQLRALDGDPLRIPGLNGDESAKPCEQRVNG